MNQYLEFSRRDELGVFGQYMRTEELPTLEEVLKFFEFSVPKSTGRPQPAEINPDHQTIKFLLENSADDKFSPPAIPRIVRVYYHWNRAKVAYYLQVQRIPEGFEMTVGAALLKEVPEKAYQSIIYWDYVKESDNHAVPHPTFNI